MWSSSRRDSRDATERRRIFRPAQLTTGGLKAYLEGFENAVGTDIDSAGHKRWASYLARAPKAGILDP